MSEPRKWTINEQEVKDSVSDITLRFSHTPGGLQLMMLGDKLPFGNAVLYFSREGEFLSEGVFTARICHDEVEQNPGGSCLLPDKVSV
jgi:hypothetical protein